MQTFIKLLFKKGVKKPVPLGRWEHRIPESKIEIKSILSNIDNCGDHICGKPTLLKQVLEQKNKKK